MKPGSFLLLTLLLFFLYSDIAAQNLRRYCREYPKPLCPRDYRPICGSDGRTYPNKCNFCNAYIRSGRRLRLRRFGRC